MYKANKNIILINIQKKFKKMRKFSLKVLKKKKNNNPTT